MLKPATVHQEFRVLRRMLNVAVRKKLLPANPCAGVEFPVTVKGCSGRTTWRGRSSSGSSSMRPSICSNLIRIITETGLRVYKELAPMKKEQVDLENAVVWIPDSKTPNGVAEVPLTDLAVEAFRDQIGSRDRDRFCFRARRIRRGIRRRSRRSGTQRLRRAKRPVLPDLRSAVYLCDSAQRGWRRGRMGYAVAAARRREGVQEVLADEAADETGGAAEAEPEGQRDGGFGAGRLVLRQFWDRFRYESEQGNCHADGIGCKIKGFDVGA